MSEFKTIKLEDADGHARELLGKINDGFGMVPNIYSVMANSSSTLAATMAFGQELDNGSLSPRIKEKIALVVGNDNSCQYCVSAHSAVAERLKLNADEIVEAQKGKSEDKKEQAILNLAISLNSNHGHGDNSAVQAAFDAGVSAEEIIEIVGQVVKNIMTNTFNGIAGTEIDFPIKELI